MLAFLNSQDLKMFSHSTSPYLPLSFIESLKVLTNWETERSEIWGLLYIMNIKFNMLLFILRYFKENFRIYQK